MTGARHTALWRPPDGTPSRFLAINLTVAKLTDT